jgi:hypothetical protein
MTNLIDTAGVLAAQIAELTDQLDAIKNELKAQGVGAHAGEVFEALVFEQSRISDDAATKAIIDEAILVAREGLSPQWKTAHPPIVKTSLAVKIGARKSVAARKVA